MTISSPNVHMTHVKCGGQITLETFEVGRCDRCGLAGIVCQAPR